MYYHVRITQSSNKAHDETKVDMTEEQLHARIIEPYDIGEPIIINGKTIPPSDIQRIRVSKSQESAQILIERLRQKDRDSSFIFLGGPSLEWRAADRAEDITDELIQGSPGYRARTESRPRVGTQVEAGTDSAKAKVFIVHGHDIALKNDLEVLLRELNLEPIVLHRQPDEGLTIIEKSEKNSDVEFAFILLTPDDIASTSEEMKLPERERKIEFRARRNVIFEFGYFIGVLGRSRVCCIYKEGVTLPSDLSGLLYKKISSSIEEIGYSLIKELQNAKISIKV